VFLFWRRFLLFLYRTKVSGVNALTRRRDVVAAKSLKEILMIWVSERTSFYSCGRKDMFNMR
jgi:hypothetical protein